MSNFIQDCILGDALPEEVDDYVDAWHSKDTDVQLHRFLGMTRSEYSLWVEDPSILPLIITAHRLGKNVAELIEETEALPLAARASDPAKARKLLKWLKKNGLWE